MKRSGQAGTRLRAARELFDEHGVDEATTLLLAAGEDVHEVCVFFDGRPLANVMGEPLTGVVLATYGELTRVA